MDEIDNKILKILAQRSNMTMTDIAGHINLSVPATAKRINKLSENKIIEHYSLVINPNAVGKPMLAHIFIVLERLTYVNEFMRLVNSDKDILECFAIAGEFDYILKVCAKNMLDLEQKIIKLKEVKGVRKTNTIIVLYTHKYLHTILPD